MTTGISIILVVRNEQAYIERSLKSLLEQETPGIDLEILVVDGMSTDKTVDLVNAIAESDSRVVVLRNELRRTPQGLNLGLARARGEYVCICGAHTVYPPDYVAVCLAEMKRTGAIGCSGQLNTSPGKDTIQARLISWALSHSFGCSSSSVRTQTAGFVDTLPYPLFEKKALIDLGGYDTKLSRNQDNDMNHRLVEQGHKLYLTSLVRCDYFVRPTLGSLVRHAFQSGLWNAISFRTNRSSMSLRHFVPFFFLSSLVLAGLIAILGWQSSGTLRLWLQTPLGLIAGLYLICALIAGIQVSWQKKSAAALVLPVVFFLFHCSYGAGTLYGAVSGKSA